MVKCECYLLPVLLLLTHPLQLNNNNDNNNIECMNGCIEALKDMFTTVYKYCSLFHLSFFNGNIHIKQ